MEVVVALAILGILCWVYAIAEFWSVNRKPTPEQRIRSQVQTAVSQVDAALRTAHRRMDEAAGYRERGEVRGGDDLGGNWQGW